MSEFCKLILTEACFALMKSLNRCCFAYERRCVAYYAETGYTDQ